MAQLSKQTRNLLMGAGAAVVVIVIAIIIAVSVGAGPAVAPIPEGSASASATPSPTPSSDATDVPPAAGDTPEPLLGEPVADAVAPDATADFGDQVTATISGVTPFTAEASGIGEVNGPAVRVGVTISNGSAAAIPLDSVTVNAYYGADATPASPVTSDAASRPFAGSLAPGAGADGSYAFSVPEGEADSLVISVSKAPGQPLVVFGR